MGNVVRAGPVVRVIIVDFSIKFISMGRRFFEDFERIVFLSFFRRIVMQRGDFFQNRVFDSLGVANRVKRKRKIKGGKKEREG